MKTIWQVILNKVFCFIRRWDLRWKPLRVWLGFYIDRSCNKASSYNLFRWQRDPSLHISPASEMVSHRHTGGHESWSSQISCDRLVKVIRLLHALMLQMVISSLPNLLSAWYSALYCPSYHSDVNANAIENRIKTQEPMSSCCATFL